jgi:hypothetical protein
MKIEVRAKSDKGFRRLGKFWGPEPVEVDLSETDAKVLLAEAQLLTRKLEGAAAGKLEGAAIAADDPKKK